MLLRSITKHVKDQNWFAVALDFVIVVVGVGFAMYGQQWLSDRQQRADMAIAENALQAGKSALNCRRALCLPIKPTLQ